MRHKKNLIDIHLHNYINVMIRWKIYWRCKWVSWQTK